MARNYYIVRVAPRVRPLHATVDTILITFDPPMGELKLIANFIVCG